MLSRKNWYIKRLDPDIPEDSLSMTIAKKALNEYRYGKSRCNKRYLYGNIRQQLWTDDKTVAHLLKQIKYREKIQEIERRENRKTAIHQWDESYLDEKHKQRCLQNAQKEYMRYARRERRISEKEAAKQRKLVRESFAPSSSENSTIRRLFTKA